MAKLAAAVVGVIVSVSSLLVPAVAVAQPTTSRAAVVSVGEYALPPEAQAPFGIAPGPAGNVWFGAGNHVGQITGSGRAVSYRVPTPNASVGWLTRGPDGAMWFAEREGNKIGRVDAGGRITEIELPTPASVPQAMVFDRRGRLWYTASEANKLGRIDADGTITEFAVPTPAALPLGITLGPDNALWFTERSAEKIGRFDLAAEQFIEYPLAAGSNPQRIVLGRDGALWFTEFLPSKLGRITVRGQLTEYAVASQPVGIAADRDGLWYAGFNAARIGRVDYHGASAAEYQVPTPGSRPFQIIVMRGRNAGVWFTEQAANQVGQLTLPHR